MRKNPPLYQAVRDRLLKRIGSGELKVGDHLEPEIELADTYGVSRATMRSAISDLVQSGLLVRRPGVGTLIVRSSPRVRSTGLFELMSGFAEATEGAQVLILDSGNQKPTAAVSEAMELPRTAKMLRIYALCKAADVPVAVCETWLPEDLGISPAEPRVAPLYDLLEQTYGKRISHGQDTVTAVSATGDTAGLLGVPEGSPLISIERVAYDGNGAPLLYSRSQFRSEAYSYTVTLTRDSHAA